MARAIVHVGTHKTATTMLQDMFFHNRKLLWKRGILYPQVGRSHGHHGLVCPWNPLPAPYGVDDPEREWRAVVAAARGRDVTLLLSSEELSRALPRKVAMRELRARLDGIDDIRVICTLRNQRSYLQSIYQQISRDRPGPPFEAFHAQAMRSGFASGLWLDYNGLYDHLLTGFDASEITLVSYEAAAAAPGGILGRFLDLAGSGLRPADLTPFAEGASNTSPEPLATLVANQIAAPNRYEPWLIAAVTAALRDSFGAEQRTTLFNKAEEHRMETQFGPANRRLEERVAALQPDFALAPILPAGDPVRRSQLTVPVWRQIARAVYRARRAAAAAAATGS